LNISPLQRGLKECNKHAAAFCVAGCLLFGPPVNAAETNNKQVFGTLEQAIIEASDATYPVLKSLTADSINPLANKVANLITKKIASEKLALAADSAANALLSISDDKVGKFTSIVKESYTGVSSADSCATTIPLPLNAINIVANSDGVAKLDLVKVSQVLKKFSSITQAVPFSTEKGILCLPDSQEGLEQIWIGQTELVLSLRPFPPSFQDFAVKGAAAAKSIPNADLLRVLPDAKKIISGVDRKTANKFQDSGKNLDKVLKQDRRFQ
jgi:hypothetical protein